MPVLLELYLQLYGVLSWMMWECLKIGRPFFFMISKMECIVSSGMARVPLAVESTMYRTLKMILDCSGASLEPYKP